MFKMADQRNRPDPEDILYLYQNCEHEWIGKFRERPAPWQTMPENSEDTRYILERGYFRNSKDHDHVSSRSLT